MCDTCSGSGDTWLFEPIDVPSSLGQGGKKIDCEKYSAQQILLRISTQWRKHQAQLIDRQHIALLRHVRHLRGKQDEEEAKQDRKRKFDELISGSEVNQDEVLSKKFKLIQSSEEDDKDLSTSGGWNTWLSKKGYGGIQNFMQWLQEKRPLPFLADVLYNTEFSGGHPFLTNEWCALASARARHTLVLNNEFFAADKVRISALPEYVDTHKILPRASIYSCKLSELQSMNLVAQQKLF